jgi:hypothetical protein
MGWVTYPLDVVLDIVEVDSLRRGLEEDDTAALDEGKRGAQDQHGDAQTDGWVKVESTWPGCEPDDNSGDDDA